MSRNLPLSELSKIATISKIPQSLRGSGVSGHSSDGFWAEYCIYSVGNDKIIDAAFKTWCLHNRIGFKELVGSYKGETESSFISLAANMPALIAAGWLEGQESVLHLGNPKNFGGGKFKRPATLVFMADDSRVSLGMFRQTSRELALKADGWSFDPSNSTYWICE